MGGLCELIGRLWILERRAQALGMPSVKLRSPRKASTLAAEQEMVKGNKQSGSSAFSASEGSAVEGTPGPRKRKPRGVDYNMVRYKMLGARRLGVGGRKLH